MIKGVGFRRLIKKLSKISTLLAPLLPFFLFVTNTLAAQEIVSPSDGLWANKQPLVLQVPKGCTAFYSLGGGDPLTAGLIYDSPSLLDATGDIKLKVVILDKDNNKIFDASVQYKVKEIDPAQKSGGGTLGDNLTKRDTAFLSPLLTNPVIDYIAGEALKIPKTLGYSLGNIVGPFNPGKSISVAQNAIIERYVPIVLKQFTNDDLTAGIFTPGKNKKNDSEEYFWRAVIHVKPSPLESLVKKDLPFKMVDWETITFLDGRYLYKIDEGDWLPLTEGLKVTRDREHTVYWKDAHGSDKVQSSILYPKPQIIVWTNALGVVTVSKKSSSLYKFGYNFLGDDSGALYDSFVIDTFSGDKFEGVCQYSLYYDGSFQGDEEITFSIDKKPPQQPSIRSSLKGAKGMESVGFSRSLATLVVVSPNDCDVYADIIGPVLSTGDNYFDNVLFKFHDEKFLKLENKVDDTTNIIALHPSQKGAVAYKVVMYSQNKNGLKSARSQYSVVIDSCNFYIDKNNTDIDSADGTKGAPFSSIDQVLPYIAQNKTTNLFLMNDLVMPNKGLTITNNLSIEGSGGAHLTFPPNGSITVKNSTLKIEGCQITYDENAESKGSSSLDGITKNLIILDNSALVIKDTTMAVNFCENGVIINANKSSLEINDSIFTSSAISYLAAVATVNSKVAVSKCQFTISAATAISFSCQGGAFTLRDSESFTSGDLGRAAELFDTQSILSNNVFTARLDKSSSRSDYKAVYTDEKNKMIKYENNDELGF